MEEMEGESEGGTKRDVQLHEKCNMSKQAALLAAAQIRETNTLRQPGWQRGYQSGTGCRLIAPAARFSISIS